MGFAQSTMGETPEQKLARENKEKRDKELEEGRRLTIISMLTSSGRWVKIPDDGRDADIPTIKFTQGKLFLDDGLYRFKTDPPDPFDIRVKEGKVYPVPFYDQGSYDYKYDDWDRLAAGYDRAIQFLIEATGATSIEIDFDIPA